MPDARLQRARESYRLAPGDFIWRCRIGKTITIPVRQTERQQFRHVVVAVTQPRCYCVDGLPDGVTVASCPIHPMRTVRRGPVGQTS